MDVLVDNFLETLIVKVDSRVQFKKHRPSLHVVGAALLVGLQLVHAECLGVVFLSAAFQNVLVILEELSQPNHVPLDVFAGFDLGTQELQEGVQVVGREARAYQTDAVHWDALKNLVNDLVFIQLQGHDHCAQVLLLFKVPDQVVQSHRLIDLIGIEHLLLEEVLGK